MGVRLVWELCCCLLWVCSSYVPSCPPARLGFGRGWPPEQIHPDQIMVGPCYVPAPHRDSPLLCMQPPDRYIVQPPRALRCVVRAVHAGAQCLFWCRYEYESSPKMVSPLPACARQPSPSLCKGFVGIHSQNHSSLAECPGFQVAFCPARKRIPRLTRCVVRVVAIPTDSSDALLCLCWLFL